MGAEPNTGTIKDKAYWQTLAESNLPPEEQVHARNAAISARYARWYAEHPAVLKWAGMAAFACHRVGLALLPYEFIQVENAEFSARHKGSSEPVLAHVLADLNKIRQTNNEVFHDIGWAHVAYTAADGGLAAIEACVSQDAQSKFLYEGFRLVEQGRQLLAQKPAERKAAEKLIWQGNTLLLRQEQAIIVQPHFEQFDLDMREFLSLFTIMDFNATYLPLIAQYSSDFAWFLWVRGLWLLLWTRSLPNIANWRHRWFWAEKALIPLWKRVEAKDYRLPQKLRMLMRGDQTLAPKLPANLPATQQKTVIVVGGGVAGLSAAHELAERGFAVKVYEKRSVAGGKARSVWVKGSGQANAAGQLLHDLPGEHGYRFFPHFYRHLPDTLQRIPYSSNKKGVLDNLMEGERMVIAEADKPLITMPTHLPRNLRDLRDLLGGFMEEAAEFSDADMRFLMERLWQFATSCEDRKLEEYEKIVWWDYVDAAARSRAYQEFASIARATVAANPRLAETRTQGNMALEMIYGLSRFRGSNDRLLNGPTSSVWIDPWVQHLEKLGVEFHFDAQLAAIYCEQQLIQHVTVQHKEGPLEDVTGDYYLVCMPVEAIARVLTADIVHKPQQEPEHDPTYTNVLKADPQLAGILQLSKSVSWMNGIQFYLVQDRPIAPGHIMCLDSPWALTFISQHQYWPNFDFSQYGDGTVAGILSVDISNWDVSGVQVVKKPANECTLDEIAKESWAQLKASLNKPGQEILLDADLHPTFWYHIDSDIQPDQRHPGHDTNAEPLLINKASTWALRPGAATRVCNLFLASDYVRTNTQLATMEAANEAARRAVNAILDAADSHAPLCQIWPLYEPWLLAPWRWYDRWHFRRGQPWRGQLPWLIRLGYTLMQFLFRLWRKPG